MSDGEVMERLWSYLRSFGRMTKEMRPAHRIDVLVHALVYYGIKKKKKLCKSVIINAHNTLILFNLDNVLATRFNKALNMRKVAKEAFDKMTSADGMYMMAQRFN